LGPVVVGGWGCGGLGLSSPTLFEPGVHGAGTVGRHGCGVRTPAAAAVAAATCGLRGEVHIPNGARFTVGLMSCTVAAGAELPNEVPLRGGIERDDGEVPIEQDRLAPCTTSLGIAFFSVVLRGSSAFNSVPRQANLWVSQSGSGRLPSAWYRAISACS
jgi:hypothetical protein